MPNTPKLREDERLKIGEDGWTREYSECWHDGYGFGKRQAKKKLTQELSTLKAQVRKEIEEQITKMENSNWLHGMGLSGSQAEYIEANIKASYRSIPSLKGEK